ncbi:MAG: hypothetical protein ACP5PT_05040 [Brevinematia bacterium]
MEKAKMMLNSILHEKNKIDRTILIRYYISEFSTSNPVFLFQFFKLLLKYIYEEGDFEMLDLIVDNFYDELCMYGYYSTNEFNLILEGFASSGSLAYVVKMVKFIPELGDKKTLKILKSFLNSIYSLNYFDPKDIFVIKKAIFDLSNKLYRVKKDQDVDIIDQGIFVKWKKFEVVE